MMILPGQPAKFNILRIRTPRNLRSLHNIGAALGNPGKLPCTGFAAIDFRDSILNGWSSRYLQKIDPQRVLWMTLEYGTPRQVAPIRLLSR